MFYEERKPRRRRKRKSCLGRLIKLCLLLAAAYVVLTICATSTLSGLMSGLTPDGLPGGWRNILLLGSDQVGNGSARTDTIIVASISTGDQVKLTSVMRDTLVQLEGHGAQKINAAYTFGGAQMAMDAVNQYFRLNIKQYALIDFQGFAQMVDAVGGVRVDVTKAEMQAMNQKSGHKLKEYGSDILLDATQALRYARIRKIDSDYARTGRQRALLQALLERVRQCKNPAQLLAFAQAALEAVQTNITLPDMALLAARVLLHGGEMTQYRVPAEGTYESGILNGVWSIRPDFEANRKLLRQFIYG